MSDSIRPGSWSCLRAAAAVGTILLVAGCGGGYGGGNSSSGTSNSSLLPMIMQQPANVTAAVGQPATFSVVASSANPLSYQWRRSGATIAGAMAATYTLAAATAADNGATFTVMVTNLYGSVESSPAMLTVQ